MLICLIPLLVVAIGVEPKEIPIKTLVQGNNQFAVDLYGKVKKRPGNLFFSPFSIASALAMTYAGAEGETAREMAATLHLPADRITLDQGFAALTDQILGGDPNKHYQLDTANALWGQSGLDYRAEFLKRCESSFKATLHPLDFAADPEKARLTINAWVEERTHDKIKNLLGPGVLKPETDLILTNAIYFKAAWMKTFARSATTDQDFTTETGKVTVPMMSKSTQFRYFEAENGLQILELPYLGSPISMVVLLPKESDGLGGLETSLNADKLESWFTKLGSPQTVNLSLPRFKLEESFQLGATLRELGMARAFGSTADFSGITTSRRLAITNVIHKAFVDVNEEGTEAAAATAVILGRMAAMLPQHPPVTFRADHPFLFLIRDSRSGSILFLGREANPCG
jgi:serpin B